VQAMDRVAMTDNLGHSRNLAGVQQLQWHGNDHGWPYLSRDIY
jgi:hypothetical protein